MDAIRVSKVEKVACTKNASTLLGTIHLTAHHLIFRYDDVNEKEMWVPYPLISLVTRLPQTHQGQCPLNFHSRTFETFSLAFNKESDASDVFDSVKELTVATSVQQLYAFFYSPNPPLPTSDGWSIYSPRDEFGRMGIGSRTKAWRFTDINKDYSFSPTYPSRLVVPTRISDATLQYASKYRSKCRIPVLSYLHWANYGSITRSSQPMVGITQNRSVQDEKLIESIFQTHHSPESRASSGPVYGATTTNLIIDARPTINAMGNTAKGAGTENMDHYKDSKKAYLGIDSIHVMRESLAKVVEALREAEVLLASINNDLPEQITGLAVLDRQALRRSGWLRHLQAIMEGTVLITRNIHVNSSHVLIHCSDGWDRTSQLSALAQLCLDPFYRTIRGFEILVEKDWLSFGHKFMDRCGHLSSDKFFVSPAEAGSGNSGADAAQAFLASMQNRFGSQHHIKETSPVFHQFLEAVRQIQRQFPDRFEFNERFLHQLYYHLYSCQFGTFLFNCERERRVGEGGPAAVERTVSVWDYFNSPEEMEQNLNPTYTPELDDPASRAPKADMGVLFPNPKDVRFWNELYGRTDEEMNGRVQPPQVLEPDATSPDDESGLASPPSISLPPSPARSPPIALPEASHLTPTITTPRSLSPAPSLGEASTMPRTPRASPARPDSFRPISSASAFSLSGFPSSTSTPPPTVPPSSPAATPKNSGIRPPDFFSNSGVKSVWGKLSSNASAALSVVQEAYVGVAKDLRNTGQDGADPSVRTAELSSRDTLRAWGEEPPQVASGFVNPWNATAAASSSSSSSSELSSSMPSATPSIFENPWGAFSKLSTTTSEPMAESPVSTNTTTLSRGSSASAATPTRQRADPLSRSMSASASISGLPVAALPTDPTVALPRRSPLFTMDSGLSAMTLDSVAAPSPPKAPPPAPAKAAAPAPVSSDIDPLGVGLS
ncbi:protein-tyrosine phosphatase-like protein [Mycena alexandri]|uniref:Protein-tyrosine phosphatase-like protein n=1 Tax=Mycena alexandri TaxID=1745969 RepID=A0AAD6XJ70_9AGAR|nr:protein-tyrosine phosphatase-like protein [Mycena alexandri]